MASVVFPKAGKWKRVFFKTLPAQLRVISYRLYFKINKMKLYGCEKNCNSGCFF